MCLQDLLIRHLLHLQAACPCLQGDDLLQAPTLHAGITLHLAACAVTESMPACAALPLQPDTSENTHLSSGTCTWQCTKPTAACRLASTLRPTHRMSLLLQATSTASSCCLTTHLAWQTQPAVSTA